MKYRILRDEKSSYSSIRFTPQVRDGDKWRDLARDVGYDAAMRIIAAHQYSGSQYTVVWTDEPPRTLLQRLADWWRRL